MHRFSKPAALLALLALLLTFMAVTAFWCLQKSNVFNKESVHVFLPLQITLSPEILQPVLPGSRTGLPYDIRFSAGN